MMNSFDTYNKTLSDVRWLVKNKQGVKALELYHTLFPGTTFKEMRTFLYSACPLRNPNN